MAPTAPKYSLDELLAQLEDADPSRRRAALSALSALGGGDEIFHVVRQVVGTDPDVGVRYTGRCMLFRRRVRMPGIDVTPPEGLRPNQIARLLDRADAYTRIRYARSLCQAYGPGVLPVLAAHLRPDEDPWVLSAVIQAFRRHGCPEDMARILPFLRHPDPRVVADSIEALADLDPRRSLPYLGTFLRSPDNRIQANAIVACHDLAPRRALEALRGLARRPEVWMRVSALYCIDALDGGEVLRIAEAMGREEGEPWIRKRIDRILETKASDIVLRDSPGTEDVDLPSPVLAAPPPLRDTTRSHGAPGDRDLLVAALREDLASEEPAVRSGAVLALAQNVDPGVALPELERVEAHDPSLEVRFLTRRHLARVSEDLKKSRPVDNTVILATRAAEADIPQLLDRCRPENLPEMYLLLADRFGPTAIPWFRSELERRGNALVLSALVHALIPLLPPEERLPVLGRLLAHPNARVVADAAELIAAEGDALSFSLLVPLLSHEDNRVRANAVTALVSHDRPRAIQTLGLMVKSSRAAARASALHCLRSIEGEDALGLAVLLWQKEDDTGQLRKLATLLQERLDEAHVLPLAADAIHRTDRKGAIAAEIVDAVCRRSGLDRAALDERARRHTNRIRPLVDQAGGRLDELAPTIVEGGTAPGWIPPGEAAAAEKGDDGLETVLVWLRQGRRSLVVAGATGLVLLLFIFLVGAPSRPERDGRSVRSAPVSELEAAAREARAGAMRGRTVTWEGRVLRRYPEAVVLKAGTRTFIARAAPPADLDLRKGDVVQVRGTVTSSNTAGAIYLEPRDWKLLSPKARREATSIKGSDLSAWAPRWARERRGAPEDRR